MRYNHLFRHDSREVPVKSAAIFSKPGKAELAQIAPQLVGWLRGRNYRVIVDRETERYSKGDDTFERVNMAAQKPQFVIVLGGDGTLLAAARAVSAAGIPILGVNLGSLGFLTEVPLDELYPTLEALDGGRCATEARSMLKCQLLRGECCIEEYEALNDVVVNKSAIARLANLDLYVDKMFVSRYKGDGLIIATPTGSTAYSLSAGGPILAPSVDAFVITPVSPHALTHRPLVVRDSAEISVAVNTEEEEAFLSVDGQVGIKVVHGDRVTCCKSEHAVKLLRMRKSFFDVLRTKLKWGQPMGQFHSPDEP
jgi:NAD+ kinase